MSVTQFGVVYSTGNLHIRRWLLLDNDAHFANATALLGPGESLHLMSMGGTHADANAYLGAVAANAVQLHTWVSSKTAALATALGATLGDPYCAVVNTQGQVIAVIMADPAIDTYWEDPTCTLVSDPTHAVGIGWTWTQQGGFVAPPVVAGPPRT